MKLTLSKLTILKILHTLVWLFFNGVIAYLYYAGISDKINKWVWIGIGAVVIEGIVLLTFKNKCPITLIARSYSDSTKDNFDIYLPNWLAHYNKIIYSILFLGALLIILCRLID